MKWPGLRHKQAPPAYQLMLKMERKLTVEDARQSLASHAAEKGWQLREKYGAGLGYDDLQRVLEDRSLVRYPCEIVFDDTALLSGEMAHPFPNSELPEKGFRIHVHPIYRAQLTELPVIVLYQLVLVNYGEFACAEDAEAFGAAALGLSKEEYYTRLCGLADQLEGASAGKHSAGESFRIFNCDLGE